MDHLTYIKENKQDPAEDNIFKLSDIALPESDHIYKQAENEN